MTKSKVNILDSESGCISLAKTAIELYPNIKEIITNADYIKWEKKLKASGPKEYIWEEKRLNILTVSVIVGMGLQYKLSDPITEHYKGLLAKLEQYLGQFPLLKSNDSFKDKIGNLGQFNFLSTLSELSLAYYFRSLGFDVTFEEPFTNLQTAQRKDVDVVIRDNDSNTIHFEVYTPTAQIEIEGFFAPSEGDHHYSYKVGKKLLDKFGSEGIAGLTGKVLLAINTGFVDMYQIRKIVMSSADLHSDILIGLPQGIDGVLIFSDSFNATNFLTIESVYLLHEKT